MVPNLTNELLGTESALGLDPYGKICETGGGERTARASFLSRLLFFDITGPPEFTETFRGLISTNEDDGGT